MVGEIPDNWRYHNKIILFVIKIPYQLETYAVISNFCIHLKNLYGSGIPFNTIRYITRW